MYTASHFRLAVAMVAAIGFWASAFVGTRLGLAAFTPGQLALFRFGVAALVFAALAPWLRPPRPRRQDLGRLLLTGLLGIVCYTLALNYGQLTVSPGSASFIVNTSPLFSALFATLLLKERMSWIGWLGVAVSLSGVALIAYGEGGGAFSFGALLVFAAAIAWAFYQILQKPLLAYYGAVGIASYAIWGASLMLLPFLPGLLRAIPLAPTATTWTVVYLGVLPGTVAYLAWSYVLSQMPVSRATPLLYLVPVVTLVIAWVTIDEHPHPWSLVGGIVALAGVAINRFGYAPVARPA